MTETSTNQLNICKNSLGEITENADCKDELDATHEQIYISLSSHLNLIQILPKHETVLKIITYSKAQK